MQVVTRAKQVRMSEGTESPTVRRAARVMLDSFFSFFLGGVVVIALCMVISHAMALMAFSV